MQSRILGGTNALEGILNFPAETEMAQELSSRHPKWMNDSFSPQSTSNPTSS